MKISYKQALADWEVLWAIAPAHDMSGGYVDQEDLDRLLYSPTKETATECLCSQIDYWFQAGPYMNSKYDGLTERLSYVKELIWSNKEVREIAIRHGFLRNRKANE